MNNLVSPLTAMTMASIVRGVPWPKDVPRPRRARIALVNPFHWACRLDGSATSEETTLEANDATPERVLRVCLESWLRRGGVDGAEVEEAVRYVERILVN